MAQNDRKGGSVRTMGKREWKKVQEKQGEIAAGIDRGVNIEVGDFVSELTTAIRHRERVGLTEGDWIEEPERLFTDNRIFGEEERIASQVKLQVTVSLDSSYSMWKNNIMAKAGRATIALDKYLRKAQEELPEGSLNYACFAWALGRWGKDAYKINQHYLKSYEGTLSVAGSAGSDTRISPLFEAIERWENTNSDPSAYRLDIVITDGVLEHESDVEEATRVQERRNGRLTTVLLNFLPRQEWNRYHLPDRCYQYPVTPQTITTTLRSVIMESIRELT